MIVRIVPKGLVKGIGEVLTHRDITVRHEPRRRPSIALHFSTVDDAVPEHRT